MLFPSITLAVPAKSVRNPVEQVTNLLVVDRAQGLDLESKLLMLRANSADMHGWVRV